MRYVRPRDFRLNPRRLIELLDPVVGRYEKERFTFTEEEALKDIWESGEDIKLREDPRFWEIEELRHFHLSHHKPANEILIDRLWQGAWDGSDLNAELARLDELNQGAFHIFCTADPRFTKENGQIGLVLRPPATIPDELRASLNAALERLLVSQKENGKPSTTLDIIDHLLRNEKGLNIQPDDIDLFESFLRERMELVEIARGLWLPSELIPAPEEPKPFRVLQISSDDTATAREVNIIEGSSDISANDGANTNIARLPDPPVERHPDSSVSWMHMLRTIHIHAGYLPVPTSARFRYPRFVGPSNSVGVIKGLEHASGDEGYVWLDREHHRFFGDYIKGIIEWEESGRRLHFHWRPEAIVIRLGEIDMEVQQEEQRHIDPQALYELRFGLGESYRKSLIAILKGFFEGLDFRALYQELANRQGHHPNRSSIRAILSQSPDFVCSGSKWKWLAVEDASRIFRRRMVLGSIIDEAGNLPQGLGEVATAIGDVLQKLMSSSTQN